MKGVWGFPNNNMSSSEARLNRSFRRVSVHRLCLLFSKISISSDHNVSAFSEAGLPQISITLAAASTAPGISMRPTLPSWKSGWLTYGSCWKFSRETNCNLGKERRYAAHEQIKKAGMVVLPEWPVRAFRRHKEAGQAKGIWTVHQWEAGDIEVPKNLQIGREFFHATAWEEECYML